MMLETQQLNEGLNNEYLLQKKIEVMLDLQYKRIKADLDAIKSSVEQLAQEMQGLKSSMRRESAEQYTSHNVQPQFQPQQFQQSLQQPPSQFQQFQAPQAAFQQQAQPQFQQQQPQFQQQAQSAPQQPVGTGSKAQQQFQQGLTSDDVSIEKFFSFGGKKR